VPPVRTVADAGSDASDVFANLLQSAGNRFAFNLGSLIDPTMVHTAPVTSDKTPDARDDKAAAKDNTVDSSANKKNNANDDKAASTQQAAATTNNDAAAAAAATDPNIAAQLAALQALMLSQQQPTAAPTTAVAADATPVAATPTDPTQLNAAPVTVDPTAPTGPAVNANTNAPAQTAAVTTPQTLAAQVQAAVAAVQTAAPSATPVIHTVRTTATKTDLTSDQPTIDVHDATPDTTPAAATTPRSLAAQAQSDSLSRLLGNTANIRVAVTTATQAPATPSLSIYNHFVGYNMADNAGVSLANGQFGDAAPTNALTPDAGPAQPTAALTNQASIAVQSAVTVPTPTTTSPTVVRADTAAPTAVSAVSTNTASSEAQGGLNQMGLGQSGMGPNGTAQTAAAKGTQAPAQTTTPAQVFEQIKVKITNATKAGLDQVNIQLKPEALGRVDIKLEVSPDGKVHATVTADKQDTLNMLQTDSQGLERALNDAGLRADANSLQFNLRGDGNGGASSGTGADGGSQTAAATGDESLDTAPTYNYSQAAQVRGGVDTYA
jgi:flagellar hook-length control protein FliK